MTKRRFRWWKAERMDGVQAVSWENGYYTRNRTDLPFPAPRPAGPGLRAVR